MRWWQRYQDQAEVWGVTQTANANISIDWVAVRSAEDKADFYGDPDPQEGDEIEYKLQAKIKAAQTAPVLAKAYQYKRPVVTWSEPNILTETPKYRAQNTSNTSFWDRVSRARNTLDDFGPRTKRKNI